MNINNDSVSGASVYYGHILVFNFLLGWCEYQRDIILHSVQILIFNESKCNNCFIIQIWIIKISVTNWLFYPLHKYTPFQTKRHIKRVSYTLIHKKYRTFLTLCEWKEADIILYINFTFHYMNDVFLLHNSQLGDSVEHIYIVELEIKNKTDAVKSASYFDNTLRHKRFSAS